MSGARRLLRPSTVALATVLLTLAAGSAPVGAGRCDPRPSAAALQFAPSATAAAVVVAQHGEGRTSLRDSELRPPANLEERPGDDVQAEVAIDRASIAPVACRIDGTRDALAALDARTRRHPYLLTAHLRF